MPSEQDSRSPPLPVEALLGVLRDARDHFLAWRRSHLGLRGALLYLLVTPLALAVFVSLARGDLPQMLAAGVAGGLILASGWLNRRGILEEMITPERRFTRSRDLPPKYLAALSLALGTFVAAYAAVDRDLWVSCAFALLALAGYHLTYRLPRPRELWRTPLAGTADKALQAALAEAEQRILAIEKASLSIGNRELEQRLQRIAAQGRAILELILAHPAQRFRARKFLNVYLQGAERVAGRYARTHRLARGRELEQNFRNVLVEIEAVFERQLQRLAEQDVFDLDVQIEVLRKQLEREGIS